MKNIVNLSGPISYSYYKLGDKNIHLFGDLHFSLDFQCSVKSIDFIKFLLNKFDCNKEVDLFVEVPYSQIEKNNKGTIYKYFQNYITKETTKTYLEKLFKYFEMSGCFKRSKKECEHHYNNIRFHAADFRFAEKCDPALTLFTLLNFMFILSSYVQQGFQEKIRSSATELFIVQVNTLSKLLAIFDKVLHCKKMNDQLRKISKTDREKIEKYIKKKKAFFKESEKSYNTNMKNIIDYFNKKDDINSIFWIAQSLENISTMILNVNCLVMDTYLLGRMMKDDYKNIIVYAGEYHINEYRYFLSKFGKFKRESKGVPKSMRCIEIEDFNF